MEAVGQVGDDLAHLFLAGRMARSLYAYWARSRRSIA